MWIRESGSQIETAGLDLGTIKNNINMLLEGSSLEKDGIKFIFRKKDVVVEEKGEKKTVSVYAINHATEFTKSDAELFIGIVSDSKISVRELKEMDIRLRRACKEVSGTFEIRIKEAEKILNECKDRTRVFIFYIEKDCCLEEKKKEDGIWKKTTTRYNMGGLEKHFDKLKGSKHFKLLYGGSNNVNNR